MNKQDDGKGNRGVEWTDFSWNSPGGCEHKCEWLMPDGTKAVCYAKTVAEGVARKAYPHGFEHHYWHPERLDEPLRVKKPAKIFLDSMSDLMGHWVPDDQVQQVLDVCEKAHWHTFQLLTKNAPRLLKFKFPSNVWVGVSAPPSFMMGKELTQVQQERMVERQLATLQQIDVPVRWMSIEPLSFDIAPILTRFPPLQWVVIGAATNGAKTYQPQAAWVERVLVWADNNDVPVFFKGNLEWPGWREDFPKEKVIS